MIKQGNFTEKTIGTHGLDQMIVDININLPRFNDVQRISVFPLL
jgi:hypothetical protein